MRPEQEHISDAEKVKSLCCFRILVEATIAYRKCREKIRMHRMTLRSEGFGRVLFLGKLSIHRVIKPLLAAMRPHAQSYDNTKAQIGVLRNFPP